MHLCLDKWHKCPFGTRRQVGKAMMRLTNYGGNEMNTKELTGLFRRICKDNGILPTPDECFGFMQELPDKYPQMSIFDL